MLVAHDRYSRRRFAWETEKSEKPFYCPECHADVTLRKCRFKEDHFAHRPPVTCKYGIGESQVHYKAKREIFLELCTHPLCSNCQIEQEIEGVEGVRPDISFYVKEKPVAIEVQKTVVPIDEILRKTRIYDSQGICLLYLFPKPAPKLVWRESEGEYICKPNQWEKFLHSMYFGRVYYWTGALTVRAYHFDKFQILVEGRDRYDEYGELHYGNDYWKTATSMKIPVVRPGNTLHLVDDFHGRQRQAYTMAHWGLPSCNLWLDKYDGWW